jgi:hypothetical protein
LAHINLGSTLKRQGKFTEALDALRRGHELGSKTPGWRHPSALWVRQAERRVELDAKLPAFLQGDAKPKDAVEQIELAQVCKFKRWHAAAARFCADAFTAKPDLVRDLNAGHRYNAALVAALAGCGRCEDRVKPDAAEQVRLRRQALAWLRDDLAAWAKIADGGKPTEKALVKQKMDQWRSDPDLAGVRDKEALDKLPDDERKDWQKLWAYAAAVLQRAEGGPTATYLRAFMAPLWKRSPFVSDRNRNFVRRKWNRCAGWSIWRGGPACSGSSSTAASSRTSWNRTMSIASS